MRNIHFKTCTCLLGILLMLFSGIQARGASLEVQQERKISGTVIDEKGEPVIGASVVVVETKQGTITNIDGKFQVNAPQNGRLKISYIGYETQEVAIKDRHSVYNNQRAQPGITRRYTTNLDTSRTVQIGQSRIGNRYTGYFSLNSIEASRLEI